MSQVFGFVIRWNETISLKIIRAIPRDVRLRNSCAPKTCASQKLYCICQREWWNNAMHRPKPMIGSYWTQQQKVNSFATEFVRMYVPAWVAAASTRWKFRTTTPEEKKSNKKKKQIHIRKINFKSSEKFPWFNESPYVIWTAANVGNNDDKSFPKDLSNTNIVICTASLYSSYGTKSVAPSTSNRSIRKAIK